MEKVSVRHEFAPVFNSETTRVLILGTIPSPASREYGFYYGHPRNRFWKVMAAALGCAEPVTTFEKREMLLKNGIGLWDVLSECEIHGASDASISQALPNDIAGLIRGSNVKALLFNGKKAKELFDRLAGKDGIAGVELICLPSTSPANAAFSLEKLRLEYAGALQCGAGR